MARILPLDFEMCYKIQFISVIRGHQVYKDRWRPVIGEKLQTKKEPREDALSYAIGIYKEGGLVGHHPIEISSLMYHFLSESTANGIEGIVNGKRMREVGLVVPAKYTAFTKDLKTAQILLSELTKKKEKYAHFD